MVKKAVITAAGFGTRLLTVTKEQPKEMLPLFAKNDSGSLCVKPLLQMIFEQLHDYGFREFCFIIGRGKRVVEDHFTVDRNFIRQLNNKGKRGLALSLEQFYRKIEDSVIVWINQPEPKGFGHAVLMAKPFIRDESFLVHAGDTYVISNVNPIRRLIEAHGKRKADACILVTEWKEFKKLTPEDFIQNMKNPAVIDGRRIYGVGKFRGKLKFVAVGLGDIQY